MKRCIARLVLMCAVVSVSLAAQVTVTLSSPINGSSNTSPVHVAATAKSSHKITGWRIYVDGIGVYKAGAGTTLSTNLSMSPGSHGITVRAWAGNGTNGSATVNITVGQSTSSVGVSVTPTSGTVQAGTSQSLTFNGTVSNSSNTSVTWTKSGIGNLSYSGNSAVYTPPSTGSGSATVTATSVADPTKSATATVTVTAPSSSSTVAVAVSPASATVQAYGSQQFSASVSGTANTSVSWLVNGAVGGSSTTGTITSGGLYKAPPCPASSSVTVTAQSVYDGTKGNSSVTFTGTASNYHFVAPGGSDSNDGSGCRPWASIQHAANVANPGDTVIVEDGTYSETVLINRGGTSSAPIVFRSMHKWGAKIAPPQSTTSIIVDITASYVTFQDFEVIGTPNVAVAVKAHYGYTGDKILGNNVHSLGNGSTVSSSYGTGCLSGAAIEPGGDNSYTNGNVVWDVGWHRDRTTGGQNGAGQCHMQHGIYITAGTNSFVQNNIIYNVYQGYSIHVNSTINNVMVTNNTLFGGGDTNHNDGGPIMFQCQNNTGSGCDYNSFSNNIISNWQRDPWGFGCFSEMSGSGTFGTHNAWANNLTDNTCDMSQDKFITGSLVGTVVAAPQYVYYTGDWSGDYRLQSTSPAINHGVNSGAPANDFNGYSRPYGGTDDIGAYEWHP